jgi:hypothetical protein
VLAFFQDDDIKLWIAASRTAGGAHSGGHTSDDDEFFARHNGFDRY